MIVDTSFSHRLELAEGESNRAFVEARSRIAPHIGACWQQIAGGYLLFDGPESPLTQSFGLGLKQSISPADFSLIEDFFFQRGAPAMLELSPLIEPALISELTARGYRPVEFSNVLYLELDGRLPTKATNTNELVVRSVADQEFNNWARVAAEGWNEYPEFHSFILDLSQVFANAVGVTSMLVELNGNPIATGSVSIRDGVAILAGASTIPQARKQGAQNALLASRLEFAHAQGCDLAMMAAQPGSPSQRNAQRNGFQIAYTRCKWCKDLAAH